jgi:hypothetical protein
MMAFGHRIAEPMDSGGDLMAEEGDHSQSVSRQIGI